MVCRNSISLAFILKTNQKSQDEPQCDQIDALKHCMLQTLTTNCLKQGYTNLTTNHAFLYLMNHAWLQTQLSNGEVNCYTSKFLMRL
jgi:hypothetical protein